MFMSDIRPQAVEDFEMLAINRLIVIGYLPNPIDLWDLAFIIIVFYIDNILYIILKIKLNHPFSYQRSHWTDDG